MNRLKLIALIPVVVGAALLGLVAYLWFAAVGPAYAWRVAVAFDQVGNASTKGSEDETISSRAGKGRLRGVWHWCVLCRLLDWLDPNHCADHMEADEGKPVPVGRIQDTPTESGHAAGHRPPA